MWDYATGQNLSGSYVRIEAIGFRCKEADGGFIQEIKDRSNDVDYLVEKGDDSNDGSD